MTDRMRVVIEGSDQASDDINKVGASAQKMGQQVEQAGKQAERGFKGAGQSAKDFGDKLDEVGTAVGIVVGGLALLGSNAREHERDIDALTRAYGDSADEVISFTEAIQDSTNFSNDAARAAALTASTLTRAYGLTADQATQLVSVSADLAQVYGIDLADATTRLAAAVRGEGESAEALGLNLSDAAVASAAAARGFDTYATSATEAEKAAFRYNLVLEQTTQFQGAAAEAAEGAAGAGANFRDFLDDTAEAAGRAIGPVGEFLSVTGNLALAAPLAGNAIGRIVPQVVSLASALGPIGLAAAALAAGAAILFFNDASDEAHLSIEEIDASTDDLIATLNRLREAGADTEVLSGVREGVEFMQDLGRASNDVEATVVSLNDELERLTLEREGVVSSGDVARLDAIDARIAAIRSNLAALDPVLDQAMLDEDLYSQAVQATITILEDSSRVNYPELIAKVEALQEAKRAGIITTEEYAQAIIDLAGDIDSYGLTLDSLVPKIEAVGGATLDWLDAQQAQTQATAAQMDALGYTDRLMGVYIDQTMAAEGTTLDWLDAQQAQTAATEGQNAALDHQAEVLAAVAAGEAELAGHLTEQTAARNEGIAAIQAHNAERQTEIEATIAARDAAYAVTQAMEGQVVSLDDAAAAMDSYAYASFAAVDGVISLAEQGRLLNIQYDEAGAAISAQTADLNDMEAAYTLLQERQAAGEQLTQDDIAYMQEYEAELVGNQRAIDDLVIAQGKLVQAQQDNATAMEAATGPMDRLAEAMEDFVDTWRELSGLPPLDNLGPGYGVLDAWAAFTNGVSDARDMLAGFGLTAGAGPTLAGIAGRQAATVGGDATGGFGQAAGLPAAPANIPPPPQGTLGPVTIPAVVTVDTTQAASDIETFVAASDADIREVSDGEYTVQIVGEGEDAFAVIRDVEGDVEAVVKGEYIVDIDGDNLDATQEIDATWVALDAIDGASSTVAVDADTGQARAEINGLTGYQGDAFIVVNAVRGVGPTELGIAAGGIIPHARDGRLVEMGEIGPEWVFPPGGQPWLAAQHGVYVADVGSYVRNAAATSGTPSATFHLHFTGVSARDGGMIRREVQAAVSRSFAEFGRR